VAIPRDPARSVILSDLGFLEDPFRWAPDPRFLYLSSQHRPVLNQLHRMIERERGLAIIDGERGVGKSAIARRLESYYGSRPNEYRVVFISQPGYDSAYSALLGLSRAFVLNRRKGIPNQQAELDAFLQSEVSTGRIVLIIIDDDGKQINREVFEELDRIAEKFASVVVFAPSEINKVLVRIPDILDHTLRETLFPFSLDDAVEFVEFRTVVAGRKEPLFSKEAIAYIWESTKGNPKDIVVVCGRVINELGVRGIDFATIDVAEVAVESYLSSPLTLFRPDADIVQPGPSPEVEHLEDDSSFN
jgi:general secretion pathway protein A